MEIMKVDPGILSTINRAELSQLFSKYARQGRDIGCNSPMAVYDFVIDSIMSAHSLVLMSFKNNIPVGYIVCQIEYRPRLQIKECVIWQAVAVLNDDKTGKEAMRMVEEWAKEEKCDIIRANSYRNGMERLLEKYGFKFRVATFEKAIKTGGE